MEKPNRYHTVIIISVIVLSAATVLGSYFISKTNFSIANVGSPTPIDNKLTNTISVNGEGKVYAKPDMVRISVSASELAKTTKEAQALVDTKIATVLQILKENGIADKDIQTDELSLYPEYDWSTSLRYLKGQRATQRLAVKIREIDQNTEKVTTIIDQISGINNIELSGITFDIEDKTPLFSQARELAFKKAKQKAEELAQLGGVELLKPVSISDMAVDYYPPYYATMNQYAAEQVRTGGGDSSLPTGQLDVSIKVEVLWGMK